MLFNSIDYLLFFPIVAVIYYLFPKKQAYLWLLAASYYFYMNWNPVYVILLFSCTVMTYITALMIEHLSGNAICDSDKNSLKALMTCIVILVGVLAYYKYFNFLISIVGHLITLPPRVLLHGEHIILPVGISFYILQSIGYIIDVYRKEISAEKNFFRYALFISFFPQLVAGPIERSKNLLTQLKQDRKFSLSNVKKGILLILYGLFLKMVIADRVAVIVNTVYSEYTTYNGFYIVFATILFAIQIYCDFYGYSTIARGSALVLGIRLVDNFNAPYYSRDIKEFWRRWHISLSGWFRDYLYIPLGGNRRGKWRQRANILTVMSVSGLWHGASIAYIMWGLLNGVYQVLQNIIEDIQRRFGVQQKSDKENFSRCLVQVMITFSLVCFTWLFFRAGDMSEAIDMLKNVCVFNPEIFIDGSIYELGVDRDYMRVLIYAIAILFFVDYQKYKGINVVESITKQGIWLRISMIIIMTFTLLLVGCWGEMYDIQEFIYFQF